MENKNKCTPKPLANKASILKTLGGADLRGDNMQGRPEGAEGEPCSVIESKIPLPKRVEKCAPCPTTASKYNGGQFDKHIIGLDYLCLYLIGELPIQEDEEKHDGEDFQFLHEGAGTKHFKARFSVYYKKELFGIIEAYPRSTKVIAANSVKLKIDNQLFYNGCDLLLRIKYFLEQFNIRFRNITRADIYLDFHGFVNGMNLNDLEAALSSGKIVSNTRVKELAKYAIKHDGRFIASGFSWGSRSSYKYLRIYNKTKEGNLKGKNYILNHHKLNGLVDKDVYRFEYELKNDFFKYNPSFSFEHLFTKEGQVEILYFAAKGHFSFVNEDHKKRNDRKEKVELIDWNKLKALPDFIYDYRIEKKHSKKHSKKRYELIIRGLMEVYITSGQRKDFMNGIIFIIQKYNMRKWWEKKEEQYLKEFLHGRSLLYIFSTEQYILDKKQAQEKMIGIE